MKRFILLSIFSILTILAMCFFSGTALCDTTLRNYRPVKIAKDSFLKAICQQDISTSTAKVGDIQYFINPADVYIGTSSVIPKNSIYLGEVQEVREAVEGINAAMKIKIYTVITPNEKEYSLDAYVYWKGSTTIGGDLTPVAYYTRMPHYPGTWKRGALQYVPTTIREMGKPTVIRAGEEVTFIMNADVALFNPIKWNYAL